MQMLALAEDEGHTCLRTVPILPPSATAAAGTPVNASLAALHLCHRNIGASNTASLLCTVRLSPPPQLVAAVASTGSTDGRKR